MDHARLGKAEGRHVAVGSRRRRVPIGVCVACGLLLATQVATAADVHPSTWSGARPLARPTLIGNVLVPARQHLSLGFFLAQMSILRHPTCSALFSRLGVDGLELLAKLRFEGAFYDTIGDTCGRGGVPAYTNVGSPLIRLCPGFAVLSVKDAAQTLIHEALHSAGMSEKPRDPEGLTPQEINRLVAASCGL